MADFKVYFVHFTQFSIAALATVSFMSFGTNANAASVPAKFYNKSITVTWGESGVYKRISDGVNVSPSGQFQRIFYISSTGRIFSRGSGGRSGKYGGSRDAGPEKTAQNIKFEGNSLVAVGVNLGVARRVSASFDAAFSSCTASITIGKSGAHTKITGFDGAVYEVISMQAGASSCSIRDGNAFAN
jgi:hypothetical protein